MGSGSSTQELTPCFACSGDSLLVGKSPQTCARCNEYNWYCPNCKEFVSDDPQECNVCEYRNPKPPPGLRPLTPLPERHRKNEEDNKQEQEQLKKLQQQHAHNMQEMKRQEEEERKARVRLWLLKNPENVSLDIMQNLPSTRASQATRHAIPWLSQEAKKAGQRICAAYGLYVHFWPYEAPSVSVTRPFLNIIKECKQPIIFGLLSVRKKDSFGMGTIIAHSIAMVFDRKASTIELFDPMGDSQGKYAILLSPLIQGTFGSSWHIIPPQTVCPIAFAPQAIESKSDNEEKGDPQGFCQTWTALYIRARLLNPTLTSSEAVESLLNEAVPGHNWRAVSSSELSDHLRSYVRKYFREIQAIDISPSAPNLMSPDEYLKHLDNVGTSPSDFVVATARSRGQGLRSSKKNARQRG